MKLQIFRDSEKDKLLLGELIYNGNGNGKFTYNSNYVINAKQNNELGISVRLPISNNTYQKDTFDAFFSGLLPEGETYNNLAQIYQIPSNEYLYILNNLGCECIGALTFISEEAQNEFYKPYYKHVDKQTINDIISNPTRAMTFNASNTRLSLSGAQSKTAWFLQKDISIEKAKVTDWQTPYGTAPSNYIIKVFRKDEKDIALNEFYCTKIAKHCGIEVCDVNLLEEIPGAISIKRFDRIWTNNNKLFRLHQEDFCQALGFSTYMKYQPSDSNISYLSTISSLLDYTSLNPVLEKAEMAKRVVFNYVIGNTDAHLKNYSLLYNKEWTTTSLSPLYDLACIPLTGYSQKMPFLIGENKELDNINEKDIMSIALDLDTNLETFNQCIKQILDGLLSYNVNSNKNNFESKILNNSKTRIKVLEKYLKI